LQWPLWSGAGSADHPAESKINAETGVIIVRRASNCNPYTPVAQIEK
jgi:hypothetical protein